MFQNDIFKMIIDKVYVYIIKKYFSYLQTPSYENNNLLYKGGIHKIVIKMKYIPLIQYH